jgi:hypothetical protein
MALEPPLLAPEPGLDVRTLLERVVACYPEMHNGRVAEILRGPLLLNYTREIFGARPLVMSHLLYTWPPERARLELRVLEGPGKDSISLLTESAGWLLVEGQRVEVNRRELQSKTASYTLQSLLKVYLELPDLVATGFGAETMTYEGRQQDERGQMLHVVGLRGPEGRPHIERITIEAGTFRLRRVYYRGGGGVSESDFMDYRVAFPGLSLPFRIELSRNGRREDVVQIRRLEVLAQPAAEMLEPAGVHPPARRGLYNVTPAQN